MNSLLKTKPLHHPSSLGTVVSSTAYPKDFDQSILIQKKEKGFSAFSGISASDTLFQRRDSGSLCKMPSELSNVIECIGGSSSFFCNDHTNVLLIKYMLKPVVSRGAKNKRVRYRPTEFKTLNAMYQLNKNLIIKKWEKFACGKKRIGGTAQKIGRKAVTRFVCGEGLLFFKKTHRFKTTNIYELENWVVDLFQFFEKKGMLKGIVENFEKWRKTFLERLDKWLLPLLEKGHSLKEILLNKLSTKKPLKGADPDPLKGAGIKPSGSIKPNGIMTNNEDAKLAVQETVEVASILANRLSMSASDIRHFIFKNPLYLLKKSTNCLIYRISCLKWSPRSNVRALQYIINNFKRSA